MTWDECDIISPAYEVISTRHDVIFRLSQVCDAASPDVPAAGGTGGGRLSAGPAGRQSPVAAAARPARHQWTSVERGNRLLVTEVG